MHRGLATFTLDTGHCPPWLFDRMVRLGREMTRVLVEEYGPDEFVKRIADPVWFQSFGTVLAFDWNASGLTTILTAALKEAMRGQERQLGIFIVGGKGKTSRKTPDQIFEWGSRMQLAESYVNNLQYNSRMAAKVDSSLVQDGYQLYHHSFFFTVNGSWTVVQQGMNKNNQTARRYHWFSESANDLIEEPHEGIASESFGKRVLDMTSGMSAKNREISTELVSQSYDTLMKDIRLLRRYETPVSRMVSVARGGEQITLLELDRKDFKRHSVEGECFTKSKYLERILQKVCFEKPASYANLLATPGVGPKTIRALSLVAEVIYGASPSYEDPARYSFAHGGKDAVPYPVDRKVYDQTIGMLTNAIKRTQIAQGEKKKAMERLNGSNI
ncbi:MAG: hypothetical protein A2748_01330 [Candidatus Wildermuthbacteria bacterium RIFCSPHIGHO2_01_FULL_45_20]|uniref:DUF763 domain-containing protein n=1 Tax=Candidatus Wildermuthbacteria bacterium RIFCSPHIGHO2_02_FULL_45_25 TaxID=1802450 RepID=A0A1G2R0M5_9BACT|nr:MAG: hypothetical protein A2748_01330 [Candidatus Wildermuthbacteria bacterium RIFCSPHIGHO2_01_FULL_45_20]OHA65631.1 MAG: hypothetical protein A3C04_01520 [Candidatus Wildermuthbacteria bacterium RIFCSPHIGHO2_02_FULL_45_25]